MSNDGNSTTYDHQGGKEMKDNGSGILGGVYGMTIIGAAVYFLQHAATFWEGTLGVVKALFWPGVLIYKVLELLKM